MRGTVELGVWDVSRRSSLAVTCRALQVHGSNIWPRHPLRGGESAGEERSEASDSVYSRPRRIGPSERRVEPAWLLGEHERTDPSSTDDAFRPGGRPHVSFAAPGTAPHLTGSGWKSLALEWATLLRIGRPGR